MNKAYCRYIGFWRWALVLESTILFTSFRKSKVEFAMNAINLAVDSEASWARVSERLVKDSKA